MSRARAPRPHTVSGASVLAVLAYARARGSELGGVLGELGLVASDLARPEARVPVEASNEVWARAATATRDADFGLHFAEQLDLDAFHLVGHLAASSRSLGEALERVVAFSRLLHDAGRTEMERDGALVHVYPGCRGLPEPSTRHVAEFSAAWVVLLGKLVTGQPIPARAVAFHHAAPARIGEHVRVFGVEPSFSCAEAVVTLDARLLALPVRGDSRLGGYLEAYARELLGRLPDHDDLRARVVRAIVVAVPHGGVEIGPIASQLGLTSRTLQRRLADDGTTFAELVDDVRRRCAERYLADGRLPLAEVAFLLGFRDVSNFHKAFRRWTGSTPGEYRERAAAPDPHPA